MVVDVVIADLYMVWSPFSLSLHKASVTGTTVVRAYQPDAATIVAPLFRHELCALSRNKKNHETSDSGVLLERNKSTYIIFRASHYLSHLTGLISKRRTKWVFFSFFVQIINIFYQ